MTLLYFAWVRQKLGKSQEHLDLPAQVKTVADLVAHLEARGTPYAEVFANNNVIRCAVNQEHVKADTAVSDTDEVAFFPPVTGG